MSSSNKMLFSHYEDGGRGFYGKNSELNLKVFEDATPLIIHALDAATKTKKDLYTICDYGSADGVVSMPIVKTIINVIKNKRTNAQIQIIFEDLPNNDFSPIFLGAHGLIENQHVSFITKDDSQVYLSAVGSGFFDQCVPDNSIDLGISSIAMMWLSKTPCRLTGAIHHGLATVQEEKNIWKAQAAIDWENMLLHRSKELAPGGQMVIICLGMFYIWPNQADSHLHEYMNSLLKGFVQQGIITKEEFYNMNIACYYRTEEEFKEPFKDSESSVSQAGLCLEYFKMVYHKCIFRKQWEMQGRKGDIKKHASGLSASTRRWLNSPIFDGLSKTRSLQEKKAITDKVFQQFEDDIECAPEQHFRDYGTAYIHISKRS